MPRKKRSGIFFGWWMTVVTAITSSLPTIYPQQGASILFKPIAAELGLNRAAASVAPGISAFMTGMTFAFAGWFSDRFGSKWISVVGSCIVVLGLLLMNFAVHSAVVYYIVWGMMGLGCDLAFSVVIDNAINRWFIRKRGLAIGIRFAVFGLIAVAALPVMSWLVEQYGWRDTALIWAGLTACTIPLTIYFIRQKGPEYYGLLPDGAVIDPAQKTDPGSLTAQSQAYAAGVLETDFTFKQAAGTPAFWLINVAWVVNASVYAGFNLHVIPFLTDRGIDSVAAAAMLGMLVFFTLPSSFFGGVIADRVKKNHLKFIVAGSLLLPAAAISVFLIFPRPETVYIMLILWGFGNGAYIPVDVLLRARYFGRKCYGFIQGFSTLISAPFAFFAPILIGRLFDINHDYTLAFLILALVELFGGLAICFATPPRVPKSLSRL